MAQAPWIGKISTPDGQIEVSIYQSPKDGQWVIEVDTPGAPEDDNGPLVRLYMNDAPLHGKYPADPCEVCQSTEGHEAHCPYFRVGVHSED